MPAEIAQLYGLMFLLTSLLPNTFPSWLAVVKLWSFRCPQNLTGLESQVYAVTPDLNEPLNVRQTVGV